MSELKSWYVYLIECQDGSIYTGIAIDVDARYAAHASGKGARYTRARPPRRLLASLPHPDRSAATKAEYRIKQLSPTQKRELGEASGLAHRTDTAGPMHKLMPDPAEVSSKAAGGVTA
jgi:putative endonuclease